MRMLAYLVEVDVGKRTRLFDERISQVSVTSDEVLELSTVGSVGHFACSVGGSSKKDRGNVSNNQTSWFNRIEFGKSCNRKVVGSRCIIVTIARLSCRPCHASHSLTFRKKSRPFGNCQQHGWQFQKDPYSRDIGSKWRHRLLPAYRIRDRLGLHSAGSSRNPSDHSCFAQVKTRGLSAYRPTIAASLRG